MLPLPSGTFSPNPSTGLQTGLGHSTQGVLNASASAGASPSTSSPTGNYGLSKIAVAQVSVLLSTLRAKQDDPTEYDHKVDRLKKVRRRKDGAAIETPKLLSQHPPPFPSEKSASSFLPSCAPCALPSSIYSSCFLEATTVRRHG